MTEKLSDKFKVGDVISAKGVGVPKELEACYFRVESVEDGQVKLSLPYDDAALKIRHRPKFR